MPRPLARIVPSAARSNGRICSRRDRAPSWQKSISTGAGVATCTPPTSARSNSRLRRPRTAASTATSDDAHAASSV